MIDDELREALADDLHRWTGESCGYCERIVGRVLSELRRRGAWLPGTVPTPEMVEAVRNMERA